MTKNEMNSIIKAHLILYVSDQTQSAKFYSSVLNMSPTLDVPGMTEFTLNEGCILGLMPEKGIKSLLGEVIPDPASATGIPRAELYVRVDDPNTFHQRAIKHGAKELSPVDKRNWGDIAGYSMDSDGHVIAFAKAVP